MEDYIIRAPKIHTFAKTIFILLSIVTVILTVLLCVLEINDLVKASNGEIFSMNTPIEYKSYLDGEVEEVLVKEGDKVFIGDTLIVSRNDQLNKNYELTQANYLLEKNNLKLNKKELGILYNKLSTLRQQNNLIDDNKKHSNSIADIEIQSLQTKIEDIKKKTKISKERLKNDKNLMDDGVISIEEFEEEYRRNIDDMNMLRDANKEYELKKYSKRGNNNTFREKIQNLKLNKIDLEKEIVRLEKIIFQQETTIQTLDGQIDLLESEKSKMSTIAESNGIVASVFDEKRKIKFVSKGTSLLTVQPTQQQKFSARLQISQHAVAKVHAGQDIHLKLDAYNYYQYGILKGIIKSVTPKDTTNQFYLFVDIPDIPPIFDLQTGYQVSGDIILQKMKLYEFILDGLFGKLR